MITEEMKAVLQDFVANGSEEEVAAFYEQVKADLLKSGIDIDALEANSNTVEEKIQVEQ